MRSFSQATTLARSFIQGGGAARRRKWAERERKRVRVRSEVRRWSASGARTSADLIPTKRMLALGRRRPSGELTWPATSSLRCIRRAQSSRRLGPESSGGWTRSRSRAKPNRANGCKGKTTCGCIHLAHELFRRRWNTSTATKTAREQAKLSHQMDALRRVHGSTLTFRSVSSNFELAAGRQCNSWLRAPLAIGLDCDTHNEALAGWRVPTRTAAIDLQWVGSAMRHAQPNSDSNSSPSLSEPGKSASRCNSLAHSLFVGVREWTFKFANLNSAAPAALAKDGRC